MQFQLTGEEMCKKYDLAPSTLKSHFKRVQEKLYKQGILLTKMKINGEQMYLINQEYSNKCTDIGFTDFEVLKDMDNMSCNILLTLSSFEFFGFGGDIKEFIQERLNIEYTSYQKDLFMKTIQTLEEKGYILYKIDPNDKKYFIIGLASKMKRALQYRQWFIQMCKDIAAQNNLKSYIPLFKVIVALCVLTNDFGRDTLVTYKNITEITGLSAYKIKQCFDVLAQDNKIIIGRLQYEIDDGEVVRCKGRLIEENVGEQPIQILEDRLGENPFLWEPYYKRELKAKDI